MQALLKILHRHRDKNIIIKFYFFPKTLKLLRLDVFKCFLNCFLLIFQRDLCRNKCFFDHMNRQGEANQIFSKPGIMKTKSKLKETSI
jgi:hypothetical protein